MTYSVSPKRVAEDFDGLGEAHIEDRREYSPVNKVFDIDKFWRKKSNRETPLMGGTYARPASQLSNTVDLPNQKISD